MGFLDLIKKGVVEEFTGTISTGESWDSSKGIIKGAQSSIKSSDEYRRAQANKKQK